MPALPPRGAPPEPPATAASSQSQSPPSHPPPLPTIPSLLIPETTTLTTAADVLARAPQGAPGFQAIPTTYQEQNSSPDPSTVAGIVLGAVGGLILLLALLYSCAGWTPVFFGPFPPWRSRTVVVEEHLQPNHKDHHRHRRRRRRPRRHADAEVFEARPATSRPPAARGDAPAAVPGVRVTQSTTRHGGGPPPARGRAAGRADDATTTTTTTTTTETEEDNDVVVVEERSRPRRKSERRSSRRDNRRHDRR